MKHKVYLLPILLLSYLIVLSACDAPTSPETKIVMEAIENLPEEEFVYAVLDLGPDYKVSNSNSAASNEIVLHEEFENAPIVGDIQGHFTGEISHTLNAENGNGLNEGSGYITLTDGKVWMVEIEGNAENFETNCHMKCLDDCGQCIFNASFAENWNQRYQLERKVSLTGYYVRK